MIERKKCQEPVTYRTINAFRSERLIVNCHSLIKYEIKKHFGLIIVKVLIF